MVFKPGESGNPSGKPLGAKNKTTLDKEQRRILFEELVSDKFEKLVDKAKPEYLLDQFIGKAREQIDHKINFIFDEDAKPELDKVVDKVE